MQGIVAECDARGRAWSGRRAPARAQPRALRPRARAVGLLRHAGRDRAARRHGEEPADRERASPTRRRPRRRAGSSSSPSQAREFAVRELGLPDSGSYTKYADLGREYALWNVVATPEFSLRPLRWCFPIAGCVSYRGYFHEADANACAWKLVARGDDAVVEGVAAYSTLGHLPDPLPSTMIGWRETRLVGTIFHELAHERLYVAGDSGFNEAFAGVVEDAGVRRWLESRGETRELAALRCVAPQARRVPRAAARTRAQASRRSIAAGSPAAAMRVEKNRVFGRLKFEYQRLRQRVGRVPRLRRLVRAAARQREPRVRGDLPGLRAWTRARTCRRGFAARVLRPRRRAGAHDAGRAACGGVRRALAAGWSRAQVPAVGRRFHARPEFALR